MLQALARVEVGGTPRTNPDGYNRRSPVGLKRAIAGSGVPLQMWWSDADEIVIDQGTQSARLFRELEELGPSGRLEKRTGSWSHTAESYTRLQLPGAVSLARPHARNLNAPQGHSRVPENTLSRKSRRVGDVFVPIQRRVAAPAGDASSQTPFAIRTTTSASPRFPATSHARTSSRYRPSGSRVVSQYRSGKSRNQ